MNILHELLVGKMNFRKAFVCVWCAVMLCMVAFIGACLCGVAWHVYGIAADVHGMDAAIVQRLTNEENSR